MKLSITLLLAIFALNYAVQGMSLSERTARKESRMADIEARKIERATDRTLKKEQRMSNMAKKEEFRN